MTGLKNIISLLQRSWYVILRFYDPVCQSDDKEIRPNLVAFNTCIKAWAKSGEGSYGARRAEKLLDRMQNYGVTPDLHTWNTIIDCWSKSRSREAGQKAEEILRKMNDQFLMSGKIEDMPYIMTYNIQLLVSSAKRKASSKATNWASSKASN